MQGKGNDWRSVLHEVIFGTEISQRANKKICNRPCPGCGSCDHNVAAAYCQYCGERL